MKARVPNRNEILVLVTFGDAYGNRVKVNLLLLTADMLSDPRTTVKQNTPYGPSSTITNS